MCTLNQFFEKVNQSRKGMETNSEEHSYCIVSMCGYLHLLYFHVKDARNQIVINHLSIKPCLLYRDTYYLQDKYINVFPIHSSLCELIIIF